jgi:hypothetical protein
MNARGTARFATCERGYNAPRPDVLWIIALLGVRGGRLALGRTATFPRPLYRPVRYLAGTGNAAGLRFFLMASL